MIGLFLCRSIEQQFEEVGKREEILYSSLKRLKNSQFTMASFGAIVKSILRRLSPCDYPVLNSQLLFKIWLTYILDASLNSMRALFYRLNQSGITAVFTRMTRNSSLAMA